MTVDDYALMKYYIILDTRCGGYVDTSRFEHIIAYISTTACDSSLKFGMHIHLNRHHIYPK